MNRHVELVIKLEVHAALQKLYIIHTTKITFIPTYNKSYDSLHLSFVFCGSNITVEWTQRSLIVLVLEII